MSESNSRYGFPSLGAMANVQRGYMNLMEQMFSHSVQSVTQQSRTILDVMMQNGETSLHLLRRSQESFGNIIAPVLTLPLTSSATASAVSISERNEEVISVGEEVLTVGKRLVEGGKTRIQRTVSESPVEQAVELITQTVTVERRRAADARRGDVLSDKTIEMSDVTEVPVVTKSVRLVEEVIVRRNTSTRTETIRDTVKRDNVDVVQPQRMPVVFGRDNQTDKTHQGRSSGQERQRGNGEQRVQSS